MISTLHPGTLVVLSDYPDPPFDVIQDGMASGFDVELNLVLRPVAHPSKAPNG